MSHAGNWMEPTFEQVPAASGLGPSCSVGYAVRLPGRAAACAAAPLRRQVADAPDHTTARPLPTLGGVEPVNDNAPSADRILCRGRAGEQVAPPRASVLDGRQPTEREVKAAAGGGPATSQGGVWIRIASSGRTDSPGQPTVSLPVWPGAPCVCWPARRCCQGGSLA